MVDYIVVGLGLAGVSFCEQLKRHKKSFTVITDTSQQSSIVAGGLYNPIILKRYTMAWQADRQMAYLPFYKALEKKLGVIVDHKIPVLRRFATIEEQNGWFEAMDKPRLSDFMSVKIIQNNNNHIDAPFGYGEVKHTGRIDTKRLLESYTAYLKTKNNLVLEHFDFSRLMILEEGILYKAIKAKQIVFAEGFGLKNNPFFNYLPMNGTKGELLTIYAPELKEKSVIKSSVFIIPLGKDLYRVGATYKWKDKTNVPTEAAKEELLAKLKTFLKCEFEVVAHVAGIRPTVADRRPLLGRHPQYQNMYVLNGFGSRGVMIAPYAAEQLFDFIEKGSLIEPEMDIERFTKKYYTSPILE